MNGDMMAGSNEDMGTNGYETDGGENNDSDSE
jgi:hypothetical protein